MIEKLMCEVQDPTGLKNQLETIKKLNEVIEAVNKITHPEVKGYVAVTSHAGPVPGGVFDGGHRDVLVVPDGGRPHAWTQPEQNQTITENAAASDFTPRPITAHEASSLPNGKTPGASR